MKTILNKLLASASGLCLAGAAAIGHAQTFPALMQSYNPLVYLRLDETNTSAPLYSITNATSAGGAYNGILSGLATPGSPGLIGPSIQFTNYLANASDKSDDAETYICQGSVNVPYTPALNFGPPMSIEFWLNTPFLGEDPIGLSPINNMDPDWHSGANDSGWGFYFNDAGKMSCYFGNTSGFSVNSSSYEYQFAGGWVSNTVAMATNTWYHVVTTWNGTNAFMYINGVQVGSNTVPVANWVANQESYLRFGGDEQYGFPTEEAENLSDLYDFFGDTPLVSGTTKTGSSGWNGRLQHIALYNTILSTNAIKGHYSVGTNTAVNLALYEPTVMSNSPVAYWPLNDAATPAPAVSALVTATNIGTEGSAANLTEYWGTEAGSAGPDYLGLGTNDAALYFDGFNGYTELANDPALQINGKITVAAWVKPVQEDFYRDIVENGMDGYFSETFLRIEWGNDGTGYGNGNYYEFGGSDQEDYYDSAQYPIPAGDIGNWVFLVGTYDGTAWNLYRDGQLVAQASPDTLAGDAGAAAIGLPWTVGARYPGLADGDYPETENSFGGSIKDVAIFNSALTPAQVLALYNSADVPATFAQGPKLPGTVYTGDTLTFTCVAQGSPTLAYQWYSNSVPIIGDTSTNLTLANCQTSFDAVYSVSVTNQFGGATDSVTLTVVTGAPVINLQPTSVQRYTGYSIDLVVGASGSLPMSYQWLDNSNKTLIAGASGTLATNYYPLPLANLIQYLGSVQPTNIPTTNYSLLLSNAYGSITSSLATITAVPLPPIGYVSNVLANGPTNFWRLNETNKSKIAYDDVGGQNGSYSNVTLGIAGFYPIASSVVSTDTAAAFAIGSTGYSLVKGINGTNVNFSGSNVCFSIEAWVKGSPSQQDQATIIAKGYGSGDSPGIEQFSLDFDGVYNEYRFYVTAAGIQYPAEYLGFYPGTIGVPTGAWQHIVGVYDGAASLTYGGEALIYLYVDGQLVGATSVPAAGPNPTFYPVSIGSKPLASDGVEDGNWVGDIQEVAIYPYALSATQVYNDYVGGYGTNLAPVVTLQPTSVTNYAGLPVVLQTSAAGTPTLTYQWNQNGVPVSNPIAVGANNTLLLITNVAYSDAGTYTCGITNSVGGTNTLAVQLVVLAPPTNPPVLPGLVVHLPFNGNLNDVSGFGNNGTGMYVTEELDTNEYVIGGTTNIVAPGTNDIENGSFFYTPGPYGTNLGLYYSTVAVQTYPGSSIGTNDYYVSLGYLDSLNFSSNEFTVAYWIQLPYNYDAGDLPFVTDTVGSTLEPGFSYSPAYGYGTAYPMGQEYPAIPTYGAWCDSVFGQSDAGISYFGDLASINDGNWHHLVHVCNPAADSLVTYLDGRVAHQLINYGTDIDAAGVIDNGNPTSVGQDATGAYGESGAAAIADLGMWRTALTPLQVGALYTAAVSNSLSFTAPTNVITPTQTGTNLVLTWPFGSLYSCTNMSPNGTNVVVWTLVATTSPYTITNFDGVNKTVTGGKNPKTNSVFIPFKVFQLQW